ncbi:hypothetical protein CBI33_24835 [Rhodococcus erythropolis]|nr:hypothetical protein CBI33_24835 [Rhodococcus erythropolis]
MMAVNGKRPRSWLFTTVFWAVVAFGVLAALGIPRWWESLTVAVVGVAASYGWWRRRQRSEFWIFFGVMCSLVAILAFLATGRALLTTVKVPVDSIGQETIVCGSVMNPAPNDSLRVTDIRTGEPTTRPQAIPHTQLEQACVKRLDYRVAEATAATVVGLLLAGRAIGHVVLSSSATRTLSALPSPERRTSRLRRPSRRH